MSGAGNPIEVGLEVENLLGECDEDVDLLASRVALHGLRDYSSCLVNCGHLARENVGRAEYQTEQRVVPQGEQAVVVS